jgi:hypothetical protein
MCAIAVLARWLKIDAEKTRVLWLDRDAEQLALRGRGVPRQPGSVVGYRIGEDQSAGTGATKQPVSRSQGRPMTIEALCRAISGLPRKRTQSHGIGICRDVPCVDGSELARLFFTFAGWSVQPYVRPVSAAHKAAGHNALRGSGPGQNLAFDNAVAHVGCPDRRIDRLCITCCSPSQPSHHAGCRRDLGHAASATGSL